MSTKQTTSQRIAAALSANSLTASHCTELIKEAAERVQAVEQRLKAIRPPGKNGGAPGPERHRVLATGTAQKVTALDEEYSALKVEADQLNAQRNELSRHRTEARGREAVEGMPARYKSLSAKIQDARRARQVYADALREVEGSLKQVEQDRRNASQARLRITAAPVEVYAELDALQPGSDLTSPLLTGRHSDDRLATILGVGRPRAPAA